MSKLEVNAVEPQCGTNLTLGASGDTIIIPSGATISNQGTAAGFGPTGAVSWNTTKITADPNPAVTGVGYFADTTSAAFTITLPSSPAAGAVIGIADYANTFATNNLTVGRNGSNIGGLAGNSILATNGVSVTFVYVDATQGWIVTDSGNRSDLPPPQFVAATGGCVVTSGNFKIHTFTGPGTFTVTCAGNSGGSNGVDYLIVAGGGSGGSRYGGGGGGGGFRTSFPSPTSCSSGPFPVSVTGYPITVGSGGAGVPCVVGNEPGNRGNSSIFSTITSTGGGGGQGQAPGTSTNIPGGSGGGGSYFPGVSGTGNTPPVSPPQGNPGGTGNPGGANTPYAVGGGGGAGAAASASPGPASGTGGAGLANSISGSSVTYAGGGGGGATSQGATAAPGGSGGGTAGGASPGSTTTAGTANTGGGSGGAYGGPGNSGNGGSGIVVIRYKFQ
jgi:hypothetical protein